jgi:hypothetical protein
LEGIEGEGEVGRSSQDGASVNGTGTNGTGVNRASVNGTGLDGTCIDGVCWLHGFFSDRSLYIVQTWPVLRRSRQVEDVLERGVREETG